MNWDDLKYFISVAGTRNVTQTSQQLKVSPETVTRHLADLEADLHVTLFNKRPTGYFLTVAGEDILPVAEQIAAQAQFLERRASPLGANATPRVEIELPEVFATYIVIPSLATIGACRADIQLDITNTAQSTRLSARESEIIIRLKRPEHGGYKARCVGKLSRNLYCSKIYTDVTQLRNKKPNNKSLKLIGRNDDMSYLKTAQ